ncbi:hypothetical protein [Paenibacillus tianjinensis]|uniref:Lipoprotein n=1 Tax=Paenibacillus tianjinensis TaxID=2810347 RepID=A0ABX7L9A2_9BACL|nr:hypothetical protein [Paenibacillus tianjinensis]QSF43289.1 hypothetical protein JRJ22_18655 [Paenibacillus tianjinensis]
MMSFKILITLLSIIMIMVLLAACGDGLKKGKDYRLAMLYQISSEYEDMRDYVSLVGNEDAIQKLRENRRSFYLPDYSDGKNKVTLLEKKDEVCKVQLYDGSVGYVVCAGLK